MEYINENEFKELYPNMDLIRFKFCFNAVQYEDVKFGHQGRYVHRPEPLTPEMKKKFRLDCGGLLIEAMKDTEIFTDDAEMYDYTHRPDGRTLVQHTNKVSVRKSKVDRLPGDLLVSKNEGPTGNATHYLIFLGKFVKNDSGDYVIHAFASDKKVTVHLYDKKLDDEVIGAFTLNMIAEKEQNGEIL